MHGLQAVLNGYRKVRPSKGQKLPITDKILKLFLSELDMKNLDEAVFGTTLIFKKSMILRNSEGWKWRWIKDRIKLKDLIFIKDKFGNLKGMKWCFNKSKTNVFEAMEFAVAPCVCAINKVCGPHSVIGLLKLKRRLGRKVGQEDGIFTKDNGTLISYEEIGKGIKRLCKSVGINGELYAPHGLRSGGATDYITWRIPVEIVKDMGRWKVMDSMESYRKLSPNSMVEIVLKSLV